jgi:hypothetical protein
MGQWELVSNETASKVLGSDFEKTLGRAMFHMAVNNKSHSQDDIKKSLIEILGTLHADEISPSQVEIAIKLTPDMKFIFRKEYGMF